MQFFRESLCINYPNPFCEISYEILQTFITNQVEEPRFSIHEFFPQILAGLFGLGVITAIIYVLGTIFVGLAIFMAFVPILGAFENMLPG